MVMIPEHVMTIGWVEHCEVGATDGRRDKQTDGRTDEVFLELLGRS